MLWEWALPHDTDSGGLWWLLTGAQGRVGDVVLVTALGALLLVTVPAVVTWLIAARAALARDLLTDETAALRVRADRLEAGRVESDTSSAARHPWECVAARPRRHRPHASSLASS